MNFRAFAFPSFSRRYKFRIGALSEGATDTYDVDVFYRKDGVAL